VFQNLDIIRSEGPELIVVLAGDHIYKMDYGAMLRFHVEHDARCTVACFEVPIAEASAFGVMAVNDEGRIVEFVEKPAQPPPMPGHPELALASMGIYIFDAEYLYQALARDAADPDSVHDFGRNLVPAAVAEGVAYAQPFDEACVRSEQDEGPYWRDVGTIDAYWEANIDLTATKPQLNLYDRDWPIWTYQEQLPSAKFVHNEADRRGMAIESLVSGGCIISGSLFRSLLFSNCRVHSWSTVNWSVLLPGVQVGRRARLTKVVVDRGCKIPDGMIIGEDPDEDARRFRRTPGGITLVTRGMLAQLA
jgi:glucose-1-phosphate adenylyltransferase